MTTLTEAEVEQAALAWLGGLGWRVAHGPDIAPDTPNAERDDYAQVVLARRLRDALARLNPLLPAEAREDAFRKLTRPAGADLVTRNRALHRLLVDGVTVEYRADDGAIRGAQARAIEFGDPANNDWLAVNQFTVSENQRTRRPDIVLFLNGLPLGLIELKNPADEDATIWTAWQQLQTYKAELPSLFSMNALLIVSDGAQARIGALTSGREWFKPWRTISGETPADPHLTELQVLLEGVCAPRRFLALVRDFIVFEDDGGGAPAKKMAGYHQFHAVGVAVDETLRAAELQREARRIAKGEGRYESGGRPGGAPGDRRIGVVWHTQGSGKSLTMAFYAGRIPPRLRPARSPRRDRAPVPGPGRVPSRRAGGGRGLVRDRPPRRRPGGVPAGRTGLRGAPSRPGRGRRRGPEQGGAPGRAPAAGSGGGRGRRRWPGTAAADSRRPPPRRRPRAAPPAPRVGDRGRGVRRGTRRRSARPRTPDHRGPLPRAAQAASRSARAGPAHRADRAIRRRCRRVRRPLPPRGGFGRCRLVSYLPHLDPIAPLTIRYLWYRSRGC